MTHKTKSALYSFVLFIMLCYHGIAQVSNYKFNPNWTVGTKKTVTVKTVEQQLKDSVITADSSGLDYTLEVTGETPEYYTLKIVYENIAMKSVISLYEKMGEELKKYNNLELIYHINKKDGKSTLANWKECQNFMLESMNQIEKVLTAKVPEMKSLAQLAFGPVKMAYKDKETIEASMMENFGYLLIPYNYAFSEKDTTKIISKTANPFNPTDTVSVTTLFMLSNIDLANNKVDINTQDLMDLSKFKQMMTDMMRGMSKSFGGNEEQMKKAETEINSINMDIIKKSSIAYNTQTTWPTKVISTGKVIMNDPRRKFEKTIISTILIK